MIASLRRVPSALFVALRTSALMTLVGSLLGCSRGTSPRAAPPKAPAVADPAAAAPGGFEEAAASSGIDFHMGFLPEEQGEKFKINLYDHGCGIAVADYDNDGHEDLYFLNQLGANGLYRNRGNGTFENTTERSGVGLDDRICVGASFADYDNDGDQDLYVTSTRGGNVLFQNQGNGAFKDVTEKSGLTCLKHSQTAAFFDYDRDRYLDLFVTNTAEWTTSTFDDASRYFRGLGTLWEMTQSPKEYNILYHNNRDGTFSDVTSRSGLGGRGWGGDVAVWDFDDDGHLDLLVTNMFGQSQLYRNQRDGSFEDVTRDTLGRTSWGAIGSKIFDAENDGRLDLLIVDMHSDMWLQPDFNEVMVSAAQRGEKTKFRYVTGPLSLFDKSAMDMEQKLVDVVDIRYDEVVFGNTYFKNLGGGRFEERSAEANLETFWPWGIATGDFDNDGSEDVFLPSGMGFPYFYWHSALMMNQGGGRFEDQARSRGIEPPAEGEYLEKQIGGRPAARSSRCAVSGDFDSDGRLDLLSNNFNDRPYYLRNRFSKRNYVAFRLKGTQSNNDAIGAVVTLRAGPLTLTRQVHAAGGYLSHSSRTLHFGLGDQKQVDSIEIRWPLGRTQRIERPEVNRLHEVTEPAG